MPKIGIVSVEYSNSPNGAVVHIFGRDETGNAEHLEVEGFPPYLYAPVAQVLRRPPAAPSVVDRKKIYTSIRGDKLYRIYVKYPTDVRNFREGYHHFEADVPFATRFLIDNGLTGAVEFPDRVCKYTDLKPAEIETPVRHCIVDIECSDERGFPDALKDPIICITCWDSFDKKFATFLFLAPGTTDAQLKAAAPAANGCFDKEHHELYTFSSEREMLLGFKWYINDRDPDILSGWNFTGFDMPYIFERMSQTGVPIESIARLKFNADRQVVRGRALFDLLEGYKKMHLTQKPSYRLDAIAFDEVGERKIRFSGKISDLWKTDPVNLVLYNMVDVDLCVKIDAKDGIIDFYREISRYVGIPLDKTINSSNVVDVFIMRKAHGKYVLPSRGQAMETESFEGATVFKPKKGLHENIIVLDLKSLYPMSMMTINASPETKDPHGELVAPNGIRFRKHPDGIMREIITALLKERDDKKAKRNTFKFGSREYKVLDMQQNVVKVIMNTLYGVSGYPRFRLFDPETGSAVTSVGRAILEFTRKIIEAEGYEVVSGDTDSVFVLLPKFFGKEETINEARRLEALLNKKYDEFAKETLNADHHYFSTKFEKLYKRFFSGGRKKRYAGLLEWKEGKDVDEVDIVGFEAKRSDTPAMVKVVQKKLMEMILSGDSYENIRTYLGDVIKKYRRGELPIEDIAIPGGFSKKFDEYEVQDAHMRGAIYANKYFGTEFGKASKPKRLYISAVTGKYPRTDVIAFEYPDQVPPEFIIDRDLMLETLQRPIERVIDSLGWSWQDMDPSIASLSRWGIG